MYEDDPQDTVFDVLGEAVFGGHPLGRPIIGRAPVIRDTPIDVIADFHARRYVPGTVVIAAAGSVDHDQIVELATRTLGDARRRSSPRPRPSPRRRDPARHRALRAQGHRAGARHARRPRPAARRRPPLRRPRAGRDLRRPLELAALPGRARGARAGLQRLLVRRPVRRHGPGRPLRRHAPGQPRRGDEGRRRRARAPARGAGHRGRARARARERQGARRARHGVHRARACTASAARCCSACRCWRPTRSWSASTP